MSGDLTPLQERIARVLHEIDPVTGHGHDWGKLSSVERKFYRHKAAAVLPITAAEVQAAKADAWNECARAAYTSEGRITHGPNPYETGGQA